MRTDLLDARWTFYNIPGLMFLNLVRSDSIAIIHSSFFSGDKDSSTVNGTGASESFMDSARAISAVSGMKRSGVVLEQTEYLLLDSSLQAITCPSSSG